MLEIFSDMSERIKYNFPGFPLYVRRGELGDFARYTIACHWHPDLEFLYVLDGIMEYFVNGEIVVLNKGEGIFINSKRLHYNYSKNATNCSFLVVVVHPSLLGEDTPAGKTFFNAKFGVENENYILLTKHNEWQNKTLLAINEIFNEVYNKSSNLLRLLAQAVSLCAAISENIQATSKKNNDENIWLTIWNMTGFVQENYHNKINLADIAAAGSVCRSKCCLLFNEFVGQTPIAYLTSYRINKCCEMLRTTTMTIIEISMACGIQSPSYFAQIFNKEIGMTPREYRSHFNKKY